MTGGCREEYQFSTTSTICDSIPSILDDTDINHVAKKKASLSKEEFKKCFGIKLAMAEPKRGPLQRSCFNCI